MATLRARIPVSVDPKPADMVSSDDSDGSLSGTELDESHLPSFTPPSFTIKDLLSAIPPHCFERSALHSSLYILWNLVLVAAASYPATFIDSSFGLRGQVLNGAPGVVAKWALWNVYWLWAGWNLTGIWVIAHECGHQAFSSSKTINNAVGLVLHSALLVPYHSWRISHARHHAATGHMTRDEVFVPDTRSHARKKSPALGRKRFFSGREFEEIVEDTPIYRFLYLVVQQLFGWPAYLITNASGQVHYPAWTNHFDPSSIIFDARHRAQVLLSDAGLAVTFALLFAAGHTFGLSNVIKFYVVPYFWVNHWLVMITYLQHTDPELPHYRAGEWNFQRGALCTIDRKLLGPVGPYLLHGICETHVLHHVCSKIPHYHAWEASAALQRVLGSYYLSTDENMFVSLWRNYRNCRFVEDEGEVVFFKDAYGRAHRRVVYADPPSDSGVDVSTDAELASKKTA